LDVDPGIDDALALILALHSPEIRVELVTTVAGNGPIHMTTRNALRVLGVLGHGDIPVHPGASTPLERDFHGALDYHGHDALAGLALPEAATEPHPQPAPEALYAFAAEASGERVLVATGPLTNIALAFQQHPDMPKMLRELVIMGGAFGLTRYGTGNTSPYAEFNIWQDPEAAAIVFDSCARISVVGLDVTNDPNTGFNRADLERLRTIDTPAGNLAAGIAEFALRRHDVCELHDPLALAVVLDRSLFQFECGKVSVDTMSDDEMYGRTLLHREDESHNQTTAVAAAADGPRFKRLFLSRIEED
jgi:pyrimidine-specific ribonucleoside hydrolase